MKVLKNLCALRVSVVQIFFFLSAFIIFISVPFPLSALTYEEFEKFNQDINNPSEQVRAHAVQTADRFNSEQIYIVMKERLLRENSNLVINAILAKLEQRVSRKDFYYLLDFLKIAPNDNSAERALRTMHRIHGARLQKELEDLLPRTQWKIHLFNYVNAVTTLNDTERQWVNDMFIEHSLSYEALRYHNAIITKFISNYSIFYERKLFNFKDIHQAAFLMLLESQRFNQVALDLVDHFAFEKICEIPKVSIGRTLDLILKYHKIDALKLAQSGCADAQRWLLRRWIPKIPAKETAVKTENDQDEGESSQQTGVAEIALPTNLTQQQIAFEQIIREGSLSNLYVALHNVDRLPTEMKNFTRSHCQNLWPQANQYVKEHEEIDRRELCYGLSLKAQLPQAKSIYEKSDAKLQEQLMRLYGKEMLQKDGFFSISQLQKLLLHDSIKIRTQVYMFSRDDVIAGNIQLFYAALNTEPNRFLQSLFYARVQQNKSLKKHFTNDVTQNKSTN